MVIQDFAAISQIFLRPDSSMSLNSKYQSSNTNMTSLLVPAFPYKSFQGHSVRSARLQYDTALPGVELKLD